MLVIREDDFIYIEKKSNYLNKDFDDATSWSDYFSRKYFHILTQLFVKSKVQSCIHLNVRKNQETYMMCKLLNSFFLLKQKLIACTEFSICIYIFIYMCFTWRNIAVATVFEKDLLFSLEEPKLEGKGKKNGRVLREAARLHTWIIEQNTLGQSIFFSDIHQRQNKIRGKLFFMDCLPDFLLF